MVLNPWNIDTLEQFEQETGRRIWNILQMRLHQALQHTSTQGVGRHTAELTYIAPRGSWYQHSWKGEEPKSGGIATNIGIHFFDLLISLFGRTDRSTVLEYGTERARGELILENADVNWFLSISESDLPSEIRSVGKRTLRRLVVDGREVDFSEGFEDLHTKSYQEILFGRGFGIAESRAAIELTHSIRKEGRSI
jgi:UDP-N-acetyl-2-amino-2-deoxyglucuronate dehydrogenase